MEVTCLFCVSLVVLMMRCWEGLDAMAACACVDIYIYLYKHIIICFIYLFVYAPIVTYVHNCTAPYFYCISTSHLYCYNAVLFDVLLALDPKMRLYSP